MASERCSSFFFIGRLEPAELANFNVQNVFLRDRRKGVVEVFGHSIGVWWPSRPRVDFGDHLDSAQSWFVRIAGSYMLETGVALEPKLIAWVEAVDVAANEAILGIADARFHKVPVVEESAAVNKPLLRAIETARRLQGTGELEQSVREILRAGNDPSPQALLSAFRALECVRRLYEPSYDKRREGWQRMAQGLGLKQTPEHKLLADAAEAVRHGDLPLSRKSLHQVNKAQEERRALLAYAASVVRAAVEKHT